MSKFGGFRVDLTTASAPTGHATDGTNLQRDNSQAQLIVTGQSIPSLHHGL